MVVVEELAKVWDEVADDAHMRQGVNVNGCRALVDRPLTGECVSSSDVHRARAANPFSARAPECESRINVILNLD